MTSPARVTGGEAVARAGSRATRDQWTAALAAAPASRARNGIPRTIRLQRLARVMAADGRIRVDTEQMCLALAGGDRWLVNTRMLDHTLRWAREHGWLTHGPNGGPGQRGGRDYVATIPEGAP